MDPRRIILGGAGIWLIAGAILTLLSPIYVLYEGAIDTIMGILIALVLVLLSSYEMAAGRATLKVEEGGYPGILQSFLFTYISRLVLLLLTTGSLFYLNLLFLLGEVGTMAFVVRNKEMFMPPEEMRQATLRRMSGPTTVSVDECPSCKEVVEVTWDACPYCGTELPKLCGRCGSTLDTSMARCPSCGAEVEREESIESAIRSLKARAEDGGEAPETKAGTYAKLAEALLKGGRTEEALEAYRRAIEHTQFSRKKSLFLVKMARILKNRGEGERALEVLEEAIRLDPGDYTGARKMREEVLSTIRERAKGAPTPQAS